MSFDSLLISSCTIQTNTRTQDSAGQWSNSWADTVTSVKCRIDKLSGDEVRTGTDYYDKATHSLFLRVPSGVTLTTSHRIVLNSNNYNILAIDNLYDSDDADHLELILEIVED